jgi:predicted  nucleic acid-binding Zn-ribbon protein
MLGELDLVKISHLRLNVEMLAEVIENQEQEVVRLEALTEAKRQELVKARQDERCWKY